jgi:hypothetical protein
MGFKCGTVLSRAAPNCCGPGAAGSRSLGAGPATCQNHLISLKLPRIGYMVASSRLVSSLLSSFPP